MTSPSRLVAAGLLAAVAWGCGPRLDPTQRAVEALSRGKIDKARELYEAGADVNRRLRDGLTALMIASTAPTGEATRMLLDLGANPDLADDRGVTALMMAAERGRLETVRLLVDAGADTSLRNAGGDTALDLARRADQAEVVEVLVEAEAGRG